MAGKTKGAKKTRRRKLPVRLPLPKKPGRAIGTPKGDKGYDRKSERREIEREEEKNGHEK